MNTTLDLFETPTQESKVSLSQWFTPSWASSMIINTFYPDLGSNDLVVEPSCGLASFLNALPQDVEAYGIEIDPQVAAQAREYTDKEIITGDVLTHHFDHEVSHFIGNPPFKTDFLDQFLSKVHHTLRDNGTVGFLLSAHMLQTSGNVARWNDRWSIENHMVPRDIYQGLSKPMCFTLFRKDEKHSLFGLALYQETTAVKSLIKAIKSLFEKNGKGSVWKRVVEAALIEHGGTATLSEIYAYVEGNRPTETKFWREQIRKVVRQDPFIYEGNAVYRHPNATH